MNTLKLKDFDLHVHYNAEKEVFTFESTNSISYFELVLAILNFLHLLKKEDRMIALKLINTLVESKEGEVDLSTLPISSTGMLH